MKDQKHYETQAARALDLLEHALDNLEADHTGKHTAKLGANAPLIEALAQAGAVFLRAAEYALTDEVFGPSGSITLNGTPQMMNLFEPPAPEPAPVALVRYSPLHSSYGYWYVWDSKEYREVPNGEEPWMTKDEGEAQRYADELNALVKAAELDPGQLLPPRTTPPARGWSVEA